MLPSLSSPPSAQAYLGRKATVETEGGSRNTGIVDAVERTEDGEIMITISGKQYPLTGIVRVELAETS